MSDSVPGIVRSAILRERRELWRNIFGRDIPVLLERLIRRLCAAPRTLSPADAYALIRADKNKARQHLRTMERRGLVESKRDPGDRRRRVIVPTDRLCEMLDQYRRDMENLPARVARRLF